MSAEISDEVRSYFSEMGHRGAESRRQQKAAVRCIVTKTRRAQGLDDTVTDIEVLERLAAVLEAGDDDG
jgi:hypothetical protein